MHNDLSLLPPYLRAPKCGAKTRNGQACLAPAIRGKARCRRHGGRGSGPPKGAQNALKHGFHTLESKLERREFKQIAKELKAFIDRYKLK